MTLDQMMVFTGIVLIGAGGVVHYPALPYLKQEFRSAGNYGGYWRPGRYEPRGRRIIEAARVVQTSGLARLLLSLFV